MKKFKRTKVYLSLILTVLLAFHTVVPAFSGETGQEQETLDELTAAEPGEDLPAADEQPSQNDTSPVIDNPAADVQEPVSDDPGTDQQPAEPETGAPSLFKAPAAGGALGAASPGSSMETAIRLMGGITASATVYEAWEAAWFAFTPQSSGSYSFTGSAVSTNIEIRRFDGATINSGASFQPSVTLTENLVEGEQYYFTVSCNDSSAIGSGLEVTALVTKDETAPQGADAASAIPLTLDEAASGTVHEAYEAVWFMFTPPSDGSYSFKGSAVSTNAELRNSNEITINSGASFDPSVILTGNLVAGEKYYFTVSCNNSSAIGSGLEVTAIVTKDETVTPGTDAASAIPLMLDEVSYSTVYEAFQSVWFTFTPETDGEYIFEGSASSTIASLLNSNEAVMSSGASFEPSVTLIQYLMAGEKVYFTVACNNSSLISDSLEVSARVTGSTLHNGACGESLTWEFDSGIGRLYIYGTGDMWEFESPEEVPWYEYRNAITAVEFDEQVTSIGSYAFSECTGLSEISLPRDCRNIGMYAFKNCDSLSYLTFSDSLESLREGAFAGCKSLKDVNLPGSLMFMDTGCFSDSGICSITIPGGISGIPKNAFADCANLYEVTFPEELSYISSEAFMNCSSLEKIIVPSKVEYIDTYAFYNCGLTYIEFPESLRTVFEYAFDCCYSLDTVYYTGTEGQWNNSVRILEYNDPLLKANIYFAPSAKIWRRNLTLEGKIGLNFLVELPENYAADSSNYATLNDEQVPIPAPDENGIYKFSLFRPIKYMRDDVVIRFYKGDGTLAPLTDPDGNDCTETGYLYNIQNYCDTIYEISSNDKLIRLVQSISNYGSCAQIFFRYNTEYVPLSDEEKYILDQTYIPSTYEPVISSDSASGAISYYGSNLTLDADSTLRHIFTLKSGDINNYVIKIDGTAAEIMKKGSNKYYVETPNIAAKNLDDPHTVTVEDTSGNVLISISNYSALSYCYRVVASETTDEDLKRLAKSIFLYNDATNNYFDN